MRALGQTCTLSELFIHIDRAVAALQLDLHTAENARLLHDALMMALCVRDNPPVRPTRRFTRFTAVHTHYSEAESPWLSVDVH